MIDIGNSRTKVAVFSRHMLVELYFFDSLAIGKIQQVLNEYPDADQAILSCVSSFNPSIRDFLTTKFPSFIELNQLTDLPITNNYLTPETLGLDRLATAVGARVLFPDRDLLVIDAGTAITYDLVYKTGIFAGGNISPGLKTRFRALHEFTQNLPLTVEVDHCPEIGRTTEEAIQSGVISGMTFEIDGMIDSLKKKYPEMLPVLTGGDAPFFERRLKNHIFVKSEITLIGLNRILEYNVEKQ